jgi:serine/threonine protein phosphatase 1
MLRSFAIGDIHGCEATLKKLLFEEIKIRKEDIIYFLGDYIDRGQNSKGVIDCILELQKENYNVNTLRGNHEQLFIDSENNQDSFDTWVMNGGVATLRSFGISSYDELNHEYKSFLENTVLYFDTAKFIFVHAGLNFENIDLFEDEQALLWIRNMEVDKRRLKNKIIVHGHTPTPLLEVKKNLAFAANRGAINIDTGCFVKQYEGYGYLSALDLSSLQLISVKNID